jgi:heme-degrading monooxygenase HmoA
MSAPIAATPEPPYYAAIFTSRLNRDPVSYTEMAARMEELAAQSPGYLGIESVRNAEGHGITISYWANEAAIREWKGETEHRIAQATGQSQWYKDYCVRIAKVERDYVFPAGTSKPPTKRRA